MTPEEIAVNECEAQVFGCSSLMLIRMLKGIIIETASIYFIGEFGPHKESFTKATEECFCKFELLTKQFFTIPKNVPLPEHLPICSTEDLRLIEEEVKDLEEAYKQQVMYHSLLERELKDLDKLEPVKEHARSLIQMHKDNQALFDFNKLQTEIDTILVELDDGKLE